MAFGMRAPCKCGSSVGKIETRGGQDCVYCDQCGRFQYNAPKMETGRKERTIQGVHEVVSAGKRARIFVRASGKCELCGALPTAEAPLHVGHLLSVKDGLALGLTEVELNDDENLASMCAQCNLGLASQPVPLRLAISLVMARIKNRKERQTDDESLF